MTATVHVGDALAVLRTLPSESVQCCVTSPPYFGLRAYLPDDHPDRPKEIGREDSPEAWCAALVEVFREVRRVLRRDGTHPPRPPPTPPSVRTYSYLAYVRTLPRGPCSPSRGAPEEFLPRGGFAWSRLSVGAYAYQ